jgi:hypothetical protein
MWLIKSLTFKILQLHIIPGPSTEWRWCHFPLRSSHVCLLDNIERMVFRNTKIEVESVSLHCDAVWTHSSQCTAPELWYLRESTRRHNAEVHRHVDCREGLMSHKSETASCGTTFIPSLSIVRQLAPRLLCLTHKGAQKDTHTRTDNIYMYTYIFRKIKVD